jgi:hypothetical protein
VGWTLCLGPLGVAVLPYPADLLECGSNRKSTISWKVVTRVIDYLGHGFLFPLALARDHQVSLVFGVCSSLIPHHPSLVPEEDDRDGVEYLMERESSYGPIQFPGSRNIYSLLAGCAIAHFDFECLVDLLDRQ